MSLFNDGRVYQPKVQQSTEEQSPALDVYSTGETIVGTWIDGKLIYRKVVQFTISDLSTSNVIYTVSVAGMGPNYVKDVISIKSCYYMKSSPYLYFVFPETISLNSRLRFNTQNGQISIICDNASLNNCQMTVIIEYTKTTDEPTT